MLPKNDKLQEMKPENQTWMDEQTKLLVGHLGGLFVTIWDSKVSQQRNIAALITDFPGWEFGWPLGLVNPDAVDSFRNCFQVLQCKNFWTKHGRCLPIHTFPHSWNDFFFFSFFFFFGGGGGWGMEVELPSNSSQSLWFLTDLDLQPWIWPCSLHNQTHGSWSYFTQPSVSKSLPLALVQL